MNFYQVFKRNILPLSFTLLLAIGIFSFTQIDKEAADDTFCVCVLNYNMPLSIAEADEVSGMQGIYVEIAEEMARRMGKKLEIYTDMSYFYGRPIRQGLLSDNCDAQIGLPRTGGEWFIPRKVVLTQPIFSVNYALVVPKGQKIQKLSDLQGKKISMLKGSPPQEALVQEEVSLLAFNLAEHAMEALHEGDADASFVWGPTAGYLNKHLYDDKYDVYATDYSWDVAIGVRGDNLELRDQLDQMLKEMQPVIRELSDKYGMPVGKPLATKPNKLS
ncbi:MAG: transporter substrate-binding domain-containing protein [Cyclobacteriaceae bacterium]